jgi:hypothetical protein
MNRTHKAFMTVLANPGEAASVLPLDIDFSAQADGALPSPLTGATWAVSSGVAVNTPTEGAELFTDGGLENWSSATDLTSWTEDVVATSSVNQETTEIHGGSNAAKILIDASSHKAVVYQTPSISVHDWLKSTFWAYTPGASAIFGKGENQLNGQTAYALTGSYAQYKYDLLVKQTAGWKLQFGSLAGNANDTQYLDDISCKKLTTTTVYATFDAGASDVTVKGAWTTVNGTLAGVIMNLDSTTSPLNYVALISNGLQSNLFLWKVVNGTPSQVATGAITYVAGANVELRKSGTTYQMFYNGSQVGADQTISDAGIINNTIHGIISTDGGNSLNRFFVE